MAASSFAASSCCARNSSASRAILSANGSPSSCRGFGADITARRQHMAVLADFLQRRRPCRSPAHPRRRPPSPIGLPAPGVIGAGDPGDVLVGELPAGPVHHAPELAGVDEQHLAAPVAPAGAGVLVPGQEPQAGGDLGRIEQLPRQGDHAIDRVALDHRRADIAFARLGRGHGAVGQNHARRAVGAEMMEDMLQPGIVGVARGR